jgi:nucleoside-diphosphate-sugar epimerase
MTRKKVTLFGASGTMGFQAFKELWKRREEVDISILALPSKKNKKLFRSYEREAGLRPIQGAGISEKDGVKIVWGDATSYRDVAETIKGADWVLNAMAYISPMADYHPEMAQAVNIGAVANILKAIQAEPDGSERIHYIHTGTVAETGNRPVGVHVGRVGDPLKPSVFDFYAITKIIGERMVLESDLKYWASLRLTFIMPTSFKELQALNDPIAFHMPFDARMENITDRDSGHGMVNCLDIPDASDFWRRAYNMSGGPGMQTTAYDFLANTYDLNGLDPQACMERNWYGLRNFHMQYYEDSAILNQYLHHWRDTLDSYKDILEADMPLKMIVAASLARRIPPFRAVMEKIAYIMNQRLAENHRNSPRYWFMHRNDMRVTAFFKSYEAYENIPGWDGELPDLEPDPPWKRLDHGYDEGKPELELSDLNGAAKFRGGGCTSIEWDGDMYSPLSWECAFGHAFEALPYTILKAGHWCPQCDTTWHGDEHARVNPFFAQVWYADHSPDEDNFYPDDCINDIKNADREYERNRSLLEKAFG